MEKILSKGGLKIKVIYDVVVNMKDINDIESDEIGDILAKKLLRVILNTEKIDDSKLHND